MAVSPFPASGLIPTSFPKLVIALIPLPWPISQVSDQSDDFFEHFDKQLKEVRNRSHKSRHSDHSGTTNTNTVAGGHFDGSYTA